jgi:micrococcal nuclease
MIRHTLPTVVVLALTLPAGAADKPVVIPEGQTITGRVVGVHDGDSMTLLIDTPAGPRQSKIRLDGIDAPELGQPHGQASKRMLSGMVFDKQCQIESQGGDRYGRTVGRITVAGRDINAAMLDAGMAWHYTKFNNDARLIAAEREARAAGRGLWADAQPIAPWEWRATGSHRKLK